MVEGERTTARTSDMKGFEEQNIIRSSSHFDTNGFLIDTNGQAYKNKEMFLMQIKIEDITIEGMSFSPVNSKENTENLRQKSILSTEEAILNLFKNYILYIWNEDNERMYSTDFIDINTDADIESYCVKEGLLSCLKYNLRKKEDFEKFEALSKQLAYNLISEMKRSTNPKEGILFVVKSSIKSISHIFVLKVDVSKEEIQVWFNEDDLDLNYSLIENAMPSPEKLQKGAIYPHPMLVKDLKVLQETHKADYFDIFLQCKRELTHFKQFKEMFAVLEKVHEELMPGKPENVGNVLNNCFDSLAKGEVFNDDKLLECAHIVAPTSDKEDIENVVKDQLSKKKVSTVYIEKEATLKYRKRIEIDDITIMGPFKSITNKLSIKEGEDGSYLITIKGTTKPREKIVK